MRGTGKPRFSKYCGASYRFGISRFSSFFVPIFESYLKSIHFDKHETQNIFDKRQKKCFFQKMCFPTGNRRFGWSELSPNAYTNGEPGIPGCFTRVIIKHTKKIPATAQPITVCDFGQKTKTENFVSLKFWKMCSKSMPKKCQTTATLAGVDFQVAQKVDFWDPPNTIKKCRVYGVSYWNWSSLWGLSQKCLWGLSQKWSILVVFVYFFDFFGFFWISRHLPLVTAVEMF